MRVAGAGDAEVDGAGEGERGGGVDDLDLRVGGGEPGGGVVGAAVIDDDDLGGGLGEQAGELGLEEIFAGAGGDDDGDAGGERCRRRRPPLGRGSRQADRPEEGRESRKPGGGVVGELGPIGFAGGSAGSSGGCWRRARRCGGRWRGGTPAGA